MEGNTMKSIRTTIALFAAVLALNSVGQTTDPSTITAYVGGGKKCHVEGCKRLTKDPVELAKLQKMTLAEAIAKGYPPCSRCPVGADLKAGAAAPAKKAPAAAGAVSAPANAANITAYVGGGKKCHVEGCKRLPKDPVALANLQKMTLAEAIAKGFPPCSKCPVQTTP